MMSGDEEDDTAGNNSTTGGSPKFADVEDMAIAKAYIRASEDLENGCSQSSDHFFNTMFTHFKSIMGRAGGTFRKRKMTNIKQRWYQIQKGCHKILAIRSRHKIKSGEDVVAWNARLCPLIEAQRKESKMPKYSLDSFLACADFLQNYPKFFNLGRSSNTMAPRVIDGMIQ
jgi:hypothetical protein